jgi:hypothetical protein
LGNDPAIKAYRERKLPFPEGTIIDRLAWNYVPSEENNRAFGRPQSFVAGPPKNGVQFMLKDSKKYASTGGWGFDHDFVFAHYSPLMLRVVGCCLRSRTGVCDPSHPWATSERTNQFDWSGC